MEKLLQRPVFKAAVRLLLLGVLTLSLSACAQQPAGVDSPQEGNTKMTMNTATNPYTAQTRIREVASDPVFQGKGRLLFPLYKTIASDAELSDMREYLPWYSNIRTDVTTAVLNRLRQDAAAGKQVIYPLYDEAEMQKDPEKRNTGLVFFRGRKGAKTAVVSAGGGFMYVGAIHDSFPHALALSELGYNAFCPIYRPDAQKACEDLSRALVFLFAHQKELGIDMNHYSLWGGSAGARMTDWVGTYGTAAFGERAVPRPAAIVMAYTGLSEVTGKEPPTYSVVGTSDGIASSRGMQYRTQQLRNAGIDAEIEVFPGLSHGFGTGVGTVAEGWVQRAARFWEKHS
jgi:acetyl esterase/lipase